MISQGKIDRGPVDYLVYLRARHAQFSRGITRAVDYDTPSVGFARRLSIKSKVQGQRSGGLWRHRRMAVAVCPSWWIEDPRQTRYCFPLSRRARPVCPFDVRCGYEKSLPVFGSDTSMKSRMNRGGSRRGRVCWGIRERGRHRRHRFRAVGDDLRLSYNNCS